MRTYLPSRARAETDERRGCKSPWKSLCRTHRASMHAWRSLTLTGHAHVVPLLMRTLDTRALLCVCSPPRFGTRTMICREKTY